MTNNGLDSNLEQKWEQRGKSAAQNIGVIASDAQKAFDRDTDETGSYYEDYMELTTAQRPAAERAYIRGFQASIVSNK